MFLCLASLFPHILLSISATELPSDTMTIGPETICQLPAYSGPKQYFWCPGPEDSEEDKFCCGDHKCCDSTTIGPETICPLPAVAGVTKQYFRCPGPEDSEEDKFCCGDHKCCGPLHVVDAMLGVDIEVSMVLSLTVMALCFASIIIIVICCFSPSCPHYESCLGRGRPNSKYHRAEIQRNGHLAKEEIV